MPTNRNCLVLGVTGSIAAYKAADLTSLLRKDGWDPHVAMSRHATEFITPLTLQVLSRNPVLVDVFDEKESWRPGHIELADQARVLAVAPATANFLAKLAAGIADDALLSIALATRAPILVAPAMNGKMWMHPATQRNVGILQERGVHFIGPEEGMLACGYEGVGRLWPVQAIAERIAALGNET